MMTVTFTSAEIAKKMKQSHNCYEAGFISLSEHLAYCDAIRRLIGNDMYNEACDIATENENK